MSFLSLPIPVTTFIMAVGVMILSGLVFLLLLQVMERGINRRHVVTVVAILVFSAVFIFLRCLIFSRRWDREMASMDVIPWPFYVLLEALMAGYTILALNNEIKFERKRFGNKSIREAINNLPNGLCFSNQYGQPILMNHNMNVYVQQICGTAMRNADELWKNLQNGAPLAGVHKLKEDKHMPNRLTFALPDGRVLQVSRKQLFITQLGPFMQTTISDVTSLYDLYHQAEADNEKLRVQRKEIRELTDRMILTNHAEEVLAHKIRIHNELGQMILPTRQALLARDTLPEYKALAKQWEQIALKFGQIAGQENGNFRELLQEILDIAEQIGCEVHMENDPPSDLIASATIRQVVREGIINAVRHGMATQIWLSVTEKDGMYQLHLSNDGMLPKGKLEMQGGLKNLSEAIRVMGGSLCIDCQERFTLIVEVPMDLNFCEK